MIEQVNAEQPYKKREATRKLLLSSSFGQHVRDTWTVGPVLAEIAKELDDMDLEDAIVAELDMRQDPTEHDIYISVVGTLERCTARLKKAEKILRTFRRTLKNTGQGVGWVRERNRLFGQK